MLHPVRGRQLTTRDVTERITQVCLRTVLYDASGRQNDLSLSVAKTMTENSPVILQCGYFAVIGYIVLAEYCIYYNNLGPYGSFHPPQMWGDRAQAL